MRIIGLVTTVALMLTVSSHAFADPPAGATTQGPIRASVQSMRWVSDVDRAPRGASRQFGPFGPVPQSHITVRQVAILAGIIGGAFAGGAITASISNAHRGGAQEGENFPLYVLGAIGGGVGGGVLVAVLTR
jgi:hypothetical protein